jgi:hypothetical protein
MPHYRLFNKKECKFMSCSFFIHFFFLVLYVNTHNGKSKDFDNCSLLKVIEMGGNQKALTEAMFETDTNLIDDEKSTQFLAC